MEKPKSFHPNNWCKEYVVDEAKFVLPRIGGPPTVEMVTAKFEVVASCRELLSGLSNSDLWDLLFWSLRRQTTKVPDDKILRLVASFGVNAARIKPVIEELDRKEAEAVGGSYQERQNATTWLEKFAKLLVPDNRGKRARASGATTGHVKMYYYSELFRLYHIEHALRTISGSRVTKVRTASKNFQLPIDQIREFWGLDDKDDPDRQPFTVKDMARELTARHFRITHQTVSNILSS